MLTPACTGCLTLIFQLFQCWQAHCQHHSFLWIHVANRAGLLGAWSSYLHTKHSHNLKRDANFRHSKKKISKNCWNCLYIKFVVEFDGEIYCIRFLGRCISGSPSERATRCCQRPGNFQEAFRQNAPNEGIVGYISRFYAQFSLIYIHDNRFMKAINFKCISKLQIQ